MSKLSRTSAIMRSFTVLLMLIVLHAPVGVVAQDNTAENTAENNARLQRGFGGIELGDSSEQVRQDLLQSPHFLFRGDPDVSLIPRDRMPFIDTAGSGFVQRGMFQFHDGRLSSIILQLNDSLLDFYTLYTTMTQRYGEPLRLDPSVVVWEDSFTRVSLERPLTVKYLDLASFEAVRQSSEIEQSLRTLSRDAFLEEF